MPSSSALLQTRIVLFQSWSSFSGVASPSATKISLTIADLAKSNGTLTHSAAAMIERAIVEAVNKAGVSGIACLIQPAESVQGFNEIKIVAAQVAEVRTLTSGVRSADTTPTINDEKQATVKEESPIQSGDLLRKEVLEDYLYALSRFPGRTVTAAVTSEPSSTQVILDYYVQEKNVFDVYGSVANTGTTETSLWQQRIGILATQLTNNDDILAVEYQTSSFQETMSVNGYYDARVGSMKDLRWRVTGQWGQYSSSDIGLASEEFSGSNWGIQGDLVWTFFQKGNFFLDLDLGARAWNSKTTNVLFGTNGNATFLTGSATVDGVAIGDTWALQGSMGAAFTTTNADSVALDDLGRLDTSNNWTTINGSLYGSFYLDPYFDSAWGSAGGMGGALNKPLVHELFGSLRGQYAFDYRLTPLAQYTMGGLYTVRGFPQSIDAGDSALVGTVEYRLHVPRMFAATTPSGGSAPFMKRPFRWAPDSVNGAGPDWDLVLSAFFDGGVVKSNIPYAFEVNTAMYSAGIGMDLIMLESLSISLDWGVALNSIEELNVQSGSSQFWFSASIVY